MREGNDVLYFGSSSTRFAVGLVLRGSGGRDTVVLGFDVSVEGGVAEVGLAATASEVSIFLIVFGPALLLRLLDRSSLLGL